ncbi:MAG TPA: hypothetical protein PLP14_01085, partial [Chitinophagaceae bacterium]|nr:hypothetical protein [Chitinophagaceae bacterium]
VILFLILQVIVKPSSSQCVPCLTDTLNLGTGYDHATGQYYVSGANDQYWQVTSAPGGIVTPMCAISHGDGMGHMIWLPALPTSTGIGVSNQFGPGDLPCAGTCVTPNGPIYRYERKFCVDTRKYITLTNPVGSTWANLVTLYCGDLDVRRMTLVGPSGVIDDHVVCNSQNNGNCPYAYSWAGYIETGIYTLAFEVDNDWQCNFWGPIGQTATGIEVGGFIGAAVPIFTDNKHFGKSTLCAPNYPPSPEFVLLGGHCVDTLGVNTVTDSISPYHIGIGQNTYTVTGTSSPSISSVTDTSGQIFGVFTVGIGTYTITAQDALGCEYTKLLKITQKPTLHVSPSDTCIPPGTFVGIDVDPTPGLWNDFGYSIDIMPYISLADSFIYLSQGVHTLVIVDSNYCYSDSVHVVIGNIFSLWATASPPCLNIGGTSILNAGPIPVFPGPKYYSYNGGPFLTPPTISVNTAGVYTVVASDAYNCTASTTVTVFQAPNPNITLSAANGCISQPGSTTITATAMPSTGYLFQIKPPGGSWSIAQASNVFTASMVGKYEVRVVDGNDCPSTSEYITIGNCEHCYSEIPPPNAKWYVDPVASVDFPTGSVPSTDPIVIDGTLTIDQDLNIWNNPNVYFTYLAKAKMTNTTSPTICYVSNSTLKPCYYWWTGILATNSNQTIKIDNQSVIKYMSLDQSMPPSAFLDNGGINSLNGATIEATDSRFENNFNSIVVTRSGASYSGIIEGNTFILDDPFYSVQGGAFFGVVIHDAVDAQIGGPLNDVSRGNLFSNLANGVSVRVGSNAMGSPLVSNVRINNSRFEKIKDFWATPGTFRKSEILNSTFFTLGGVPWAGSAVAVNSTTGYIGNSYFYPELTVAVQDLTTNYDDNFTFFPGIYDCDRGIASDNSNIIADQIYISNTPFAIMCNSTRKKSYQITGNFM